MFHVLTLLLTVWMTLGNLPNLSESSLNTLKQEYLPYRALWELDDIMQGKYWVGQKVSLGFSVTSYGKTQMNCLANPILGEMSGIWKMYSECYSSITFLGPEKEHRKYVWGFFFFFFNLTLGSVQFSSVAQSCPTLCYPMNRSTPGLPVHHQLLESTQTHVHQVSDAIQPSHPLSSPSPPAHNPSQRQGLFQWVNSSHEVAKVLEFQLQHQSFQWTPRTDLL